MSSLQNLGLNFVVLEKDYQLTTEVKKVGLSFDVENTLEMRVNDKLIMYLEF